MKLSFLGGKDSGVLLRGADASGGIVKAFAVVPRARGTSRYLLATARLRTPLLLFLLLTA